MISLEEINIKTITLPLGEKHPCGSNVRYDDDFEHLEEELSKQGSLIDRGVVNWDVVARISIDLLSNKSKDLKVSCYLNRALYEIHGFKGLAHGLTINQVLLNNFWASLFPLKTRARANAFEWFSSKLELILSAFELPENNISDELLADIELCYNTLKDIEAFLISKLDKNAPPLGNLRRLLKDLHEQGVNKSKEQLIIEPSSTSAMDSNRQIESESNMEDHCDPHVESTVEACPDNNQEGDANNATTPQIKRSFPASVVNTNEMTDKERTRLLKECQENLRHIALYDTRNNLDSPSAYALNRISSWINIHQVPMNTKGITPLKPVPNDKRKIISDLFNQQGYHELIPKAEASFSRCPFWLDAHRYVYLSLISLGFHDSANQVKEYLAVFLRRFPDIVQLKFSDQSEFANEQTRLWISDNVLCESSDNSQTLTISVDDHNNTIQDTVKNTRRLGQQNKIKEAIEIFHNKIAMETDLKQKTFWKYYLAEFCFKHHQYQLSASILKEINGFIENNNLQYWEPELARNVTYLLYRCLKKTADKFSLLSSEKETISEDLVTKSTDVSSVSVSARQGHDDIYGTVQYELEHLFSRLCQLDPVLALELS